MGRWWGREASDPPGPDVLCRGPTSPPGRSSRLRDACAALDDTSLRKIAVAKRLGKVFCMGIRVCLFEGAHLTSSLSRSDGGDGGGPLKAVSPLSLRAERRGENRAFDSHTFVSASLPFLCSIANNPSFCLVARVEILRCENVSSEKKKKKKQLQNDTRNGNYTDNRTCEY